MNILVVDDELGLRHTLTLILQAEGHTVRAANDGASGLEQLAESPADLIICDVRMPGLDGLAFLEKYKETGGTALVIMMSAYGDDEAALEAIRRGAYDFIPKPFRADQVLLVVRKAIEREGLRREVAQLHDELVALRAPDRHRRPQSADRAGARARRQGGATSVHGAHHRRERHGQGAHRATHPRREPAREPRLRRGELRRHPRGAARE